MERAPQPPRLSRREISRREFLKLGSACLGALALPGSALAGIQRADDTEHHDDKEHHLGKEHHLAGAGLPLGGYTSAIAQIPTEKSNFYLTIDDGWDPQALASMLDLLLNYKRSATFFLVGNAADVCDQQIKGIIRRIVEEGHDIGYHTVTHRRASQLASHSASWFIEDYRVWKHMIQRLVGSNLPGYGIKPVARAPGGYFSPTFLGMCNHLRLIPVGWSHTTDSLAKGARLKRGDILLMHVTATDARLLETYLSDLPAIAEAGLTPTALDLNPGEDDPPSLSPAWYSRGVN